MYAINVCACERANTHFYSAKVLLINLFHDIIIHLSSPLMFNVFISFYFCSMYLSAVIHLKYVIIQLFLLFPPTISIRYI